MLELIIDIPLNISCHEKLMTPNLTPSSVIFKGDTVQDAVLWQNREFCLIRSLSVIWSQRVPLVLPKKTSTRTLYF